MKTQESFENKPFYQQTLILFDSVSKHDFNTLADLCDDDFGIVDLNTEGNNVIISTREEWENWFHTLFSQLKEMNASTSTEILNYQSLKEETLGYSVVDFCQLLTVDGTTARFNCVATIIWKKTDQGWKESRWHASLTNVEK
jgi:ketosteroid isomerase-like protein